MWNIVFENFTVFLLVFVRMGAMVLLNPLFTRRNVPVQIRMGLVLCLTILVAPTVDGTHLAEFTDIELIMSMVKEVFVGLVCGYIFLLFYFMLFYVGDFLDMQFGMSMARVFDPGTNIQMSVSGNFLGLLFMLYIFATNSHLELIRIFAVSYKAIPVGVVGLTNDIAGFIISLFILVFGLAVRLMLPFVVAEFILEIAMGILMKIIPQIHVFVINIQLKLLVAIALLFLFAGPIALFMDNYISIMFENIGKSIDLLVV